MAATATANLPPTHPPHPLGAGRPPTHPPTHPPTRRWPARPPAAPPTHPVLSSPLGCRYARHRPRVLVGLFAFASFYNTVYVRNYHGLLSSEMGEPARWPSAHPGHRAPCEAGQGGRGWRRRSSGCRWLHRAGGRSGWVGGGGSSGVGRGGVEGRGESSLEGEGRVEASPGGGWGAVHAPGGAEHAPGGAERAPGGAEHAPGGAEHAPGRAAGSAGPAAPAGSASQLRGARRPARAPPQPR